MKKLVLLALVMSVSLLSAQNPWGVYVSAGISPESHPVNADLIVNRHIPQEEFLFNMEHVKTQYFGGIQVRRDLGTNFFIGAGATYTQRKTIYSMEYTMPRDDTYMEMEEIENQLLLPVSIGVKLSIFEITSGLSGIASLSKQSELTNIPGFVDHSPTFQMGWHAGIGINLNKVLLGVGFQSALNRVCMGKTVNSQSLELRNVPGQCQLKIQYKF